LRTGLVKTLSLSEKHIKALKDEEVIGVEVVHEIAKDLEIKEVEVVLEIEGVGLEIGEAVLETAEAVQENGEVDREIEAVVRKVPENREKTEVVQKSAEVILEEVDQELGVALKSEDIDGLQVKMKVVNINRNLFLKI
jgi:hypothetical protein